MPETVWVPLQEASRAVILGMVTTVAPPTTRVLAPAKPLRIPTSAEEERYCHKWAEANGVEVSVARTCLFIVQAERPGLTPATSHAEIVRLDRHMMDIYRRWYCFDPR